MSGKNLKIFTRKFSHRLTEFCQINQIRASILKIIVLSSSIPKSACNLASKDNIMKTKTQLVYNNQPKALTAIQLPLSISKSFRHLFARLNAVLKCEPIPLSLNLCSKPQVLRLMQWKHENCSRAVLILKTMSRRLKMIWPFWQETQCLRCLKIERYYSICYQSFNRKIMNATSSVFYIKLKIQR